MKPMTATVARLGTRLAALLGVISLGACSVLPRPDPPTVYALPQPQAPASTVTTVPEPEWSLQIATPLAPAAVNRSAITVLPRPDLVNNYRGARWSDPAPILFRDALVRRLQLSHPGAVITSDDSDVPTRYKLVGRLDAFQSEYRNGQPQIVIHYQAQLLGEMPRAPWPSAASISVWRPVPQQSAMWWPGSVRPCNSWMGKCKPG